MKIGDVVDWPADVPFDRQAIRVAMGMRGTLRIANRKGTSAIGKVARAALAVAAERDRIAGDPFEQARAFLGRKGYPVTTTAVTDPLFDFRRTTPAKLAKLIDDSPWKVGTQQVATRDEVMAIARAKGWGG